MGGSQGKAANNLFSLGQQAQGQQMQDYSQGMAALRQAEPFYATEEQMGLPFYRTGTDYAGGQLAQAYAPQYAAIQRAASQTGINTPSGYTAGQINNLRGQQAGQFDQNLMALQMAQQQAKAQGAAGMTGLGQIYTNAGLGAGGLNLGANQAILQNPPPSPWATIAGAGLGAAKTFAAV